MRVPKTAVGVSRDGWLAELGEAIDEATQLAWRLGYVEGESADARLLFTRLGALRGELETLRGNDYVSVPEKNDPVWSMLFPKD